MFQLSYAALRTVRRLRSLSLQMCIAAVALGPAQRAMAIVGPATEARSLAGNVVMVLQHRGNTAGFCSGVVVAPTVVMTAAHCVPSGADIRVHVPDPGAPSPVLLPVSAIAVHPGYKADAIRTRERSIDLALVRLVAPLPGRFGPARFGAVQGTTPGVPFIVAGYGLGREGEPASSGRLLSARLAARPPLSGLLLWAGDPAGGGAGACTGDSGGPVLAEDGTVVALTLWASGRGRKSCGDLTQALWLAPHRAWVDATLATWGLALP